VIKQKGVIIPVFPMFIDILFYGLPVALEAGVAFLVKCLSLSGKM
jgi:hypothetical protein